VIEPQEALGSCEQLEDDAPILKCVPDDFVVREVLATPLGTQSNSMYRWILLRKQGYTTVEAVDLIARELMVATNALTYAGRKDEDGITEQLIALSTDVVDHRLDGRHWSLGVTAKKWIELRPYGFGPEPMAIGKLAGNAFRVTVRNLSASTVAALATEREVNMFTLNYYDSQRFGVPNGPKRTHIVGAALLAGEWWDALKLLQNLGTPESTAALTWRGQAKDFFIGLDERVVSFFLSAQASAVWNDVIDKCIAQTPHIVREVDGLKYRYALSQADVLQLLLARPQIEYARYAFAEGEVITDRPSQRPSVVQSAMRVCEHGPDERHLGRHKVTLEFFLRSGSYATSAIRQLLTFVGCR
jgi:tRNA pseudouridine13 synthase